MRTAILRREVLTLLAGGMRDTQEDTELRVKAAAILVQRGWGDAPKEATLRLVNEQRTAAEMSDAELLASVLASLPPPTVADAIDAPAD